VLLIPGAEAAVEYFLVWDLVSEEKSSRGSLIQEQHYSLLAFVSVVLAVAATVAATVEARLP